MYEEEAKAFNYRKRHQLIKTFDDIRDYQNICIYKDQNKQMIQGKLSLYQENTPIVIDSRPWVERKGLGEITRIKEYLSYELLSQIDPITQT